MVEAAFGILVIDGNDEALFSSGLGADSEVQAALRISLKKNRELTNGMATVESPHPAIVVYRTFGENLVYLIQPTTDRSALFEFVASVDFSANIFNQLLTSPYSGMVVLDERARILYMAPVHRDFFNLRPGEEIGIPVTDIIPNSRLPEVIKTGKSEYGGLLSAKGNTRVVSRVPVNENGRVVGAFGQIMFNAPEHVHLLSQEVSQLRKEVNFYRKGLSAMASSQRDQFEHMLGESDALRQLKSDLLKVAPLHVPVLIIGESGTGKELAAQAIHALSPRSQNRMVVVNAAAIPGSLVEAELFGYESGSFTGAEKGGRRGKFEAAHNSSIFFDEMGDLPPDIQVKLLRVLQDGTFERVGAQKPAHSDFRLISASNRDFEEMVTKSEFRLDLYYRISGVTVRMPSLRERLEDLPMLVESFLVNFAKRHNHAVKRVGRRVYGFLSEQSWPGNIRQLRHEVEKAAIFCDDSEITMEDFRLMGHSPAVRASAEEYSPSETIDSPSPLVQVSTAFSAIDSETTMDSGNYRRIQDAVDVLEKEMIRSSMIRNNGNKKKAAEELGISRAYLYKKIAPSDPSIS